MTGVRKRFLENLEKNRTGEGLRGSEVTPRGKYHHGMSAAAHEGIGHGKKSDTTGDCMTMSEVVFIKDSRRYVSLWTDALLWCHSTAVEGFILYLVQIPCYRCYLRSPRRHICFRAGRGGRGRDVARLSTGNDRFVVIVQ